VYLVSSISILLTIILTLAYIKGYMRRRPTETTTVFSVLRESCGKVQERYAKLARGEF